MQRSVSKYRDQILSELTEPRTPNEIAEKLGINQKTVQTDLMELALAQEIRYKKIGRFHIFWKL